MQVLVFGQWHSQEMADELAYMRAPDLFFRPPCLADLDRIEAIESAGYPPDEAASRERLLYRLENAADQFLVAVKDDQIVGFICGTLTKADRLTEDSMGQHEPDGGLLAIHSVAVDAAHRRQRVATRLLQAYKAYVCSSTPCLTTLRLICKEPLLSLYKNCGFQMVGPSAVVHGKDPWFEMRLDLDAACQPRAAQ